jgi:hypothetical protein
MSEKAWLCFTMAQVRVENNLAQSGTLNGHMRSVQRIFHEVTRAFIKTISSRGCLYLKGLLCHRYPDVGKTFYRRRGQLGILRLPQSLQAFDSVSLPNSFSLPNQHRVWATILLYSN